MKKVILKHVLLNAIEFGNAQEGAVLGKVIGEDPKLKKDINKLKKEVEKTVKEVNSWDKKKQEAELKKFGKIKKPEKKQREGLPELANVKGKVITRFAPEPNGYLHLGHLKSAILNYFYAKKYKGKLVLRFEDTNPRKEKKEYYEAIRHDLKLFGIKYNKEEKMSDHMDDFYRIAEKLIKAKHFYVCSCKQEEIEKMRWKGEGCDCRKNSAKKNSDLWLNMLKTGKEGEFLVRLKADPKDRNPALRDPGMLRVVEVPHPLLGDKYKVYPMYNFACTIMDHILGITHVMRDKGFENDAMIQAKLYDVLEWHPPEVLQFGRIKTVDKIPMKKRKLKEMINQGKLKSFEDLRIPTPRNLVKRGFKPEAIKRLMEEIGPSKVDIDIQMDNLEKYNRQLIDKKSNRYFFVSDPIEIKLDKLVSKSVKAPLYPGKRKYRKIPTSKKTFVEKIDFISNRSKEVRLMHFCNVKMDKNSKVTGKSKKDIQKIHWVGTKNVKITLIMPDGKEFDGLSEPEVKKIKSGETVQFERIGFAKCDSVGIFYFAHG